MWIKVMLAYPEGAILVRARGSIGREAVERRLGIPSIEEITGGKSWRLGGCGASVRRFATGRIASMGAATHCSAGPAPGREASIRCGSVTTPSGSWGSSRAYADDLLGKIHIDITVSFDRTRLWSSGYDMSFPSSKSGFNSR